MRTFEKLVRGAKAGNKVDLEILVSLYLPMIQKMSVIDGCLDEDLKQHLQLEFLCALKKFEFLQK